MLLGLARYVENHDPSLDRIWIAECNNSPAGSIAITHFNDDTAQLRWFLIEPEFRGLGLGRRMIREALRFCRPRFKSIFLWTFSSLTAARYLYKSFGFERVEEKNHFLWGKNLSEEKWVLIL